MQTVLCRSVAGKHTHTHKSVASICQLDREWRKWSTVVHRALLLKAFFFWGKCLDRELINWVTHKHII